MLRSIDLFTGVGGITLALHGVAHPVVYCDIDPVARACVAHNIAKKRLPPAPIHDDVRTLKPPKADIVVGGFPCVGFSAAGKLEGLKNSHSKLFFEMLRVLDASGSKAIFIENVPGVLKRMDVIARELCRKRGFEIRWTVVRASDVGAPQVRARWFCLGFKAGSKVRSLQMKAGKAFNEWRDEAPPRTCGTTPVSREMQARLKSRMGLMGNSVVPDAARFAFMRLLSGGSNPSLTGATVRFLPFVRTARPSVDVVGMSADGTPLYPGSDWKPMRSLTPRLRLVLDPSLVPPPASKNPQQTTPRLEKPVVLNAWATPRYAKRSRSDVLTYRTAGDLGTQVRFERGTRHRNAPMSARFVEWLMGYRPGFTDVAGDGL